MADFFLKKFTTGFGAGKCNKTNVPVVKLILFLLINVVSLLQIQAQTVDIGTNAIDIEPRIDRKPYGVVFQYERSAAIYTNTEIGTSGQITQVGFFLESVNAPQGAVVSIYLRQTSASTYPLSQTFPSGPDTGFGQNFATVLGSSTPSFTGTITSSTFINGVGSYIMVTLDTPFAYSTAAGNLEIIVTSDATSSATTESANPNAKNFRIGDTNTNSFQYWERDVSPPETDPNLLGLVTEYRPFIRLVFGSTPTCAAPNVVAGTPTGTNTANITFSGGDYVSGNNYVIEYGPSSTFPSGTTTTSTLTSQPATLSGLASGTAYSFVVRITCTNGVTSANSTTGTFTTNAAACNPATNLAATNITQNSATITFDQSATGASGNYFVEYSTNSSFTFGTGTSVAGPPYNITGSSPNTTYYFIVRKDCGGGSVADASSQFTTSPAPCNPATNLQATNITQNSATITFDQSVTGASGTYAVQYSTNSSFTFGTGTPVAGPPYNISGLSANTTYYYIVRKDCGSGNFADASSQFTTLAAPTCATPTDLSISNLTQTTARLNFTDNTGAEPGSYTVQLGTPGFTFGTGSTISGPPYDATGLSPNTTYEFAVQKNCTNGATGSIQRIQFTTTATPTCAAPTTVTGTPTGTNTANITFSGGDYVSGNSFVIEYGPSSTFPSGTTTTSTLTTQPATLSGLASGTAYSFVVRITCTNGVTSANSTTGTFTTNAAACNPATNLAATNITQNSATITFDQSATGASGNYFVEYSTNSSFTFGTGTSVAGPPYNITGLSPNTTYYFIVRKDCGGGSVADASSQFTTSPAPCNPATNLQATNITQNSATITFDQSVTGASGTYAVQYSTNSSFTFGTGTPVTGPPYNLSGLSANTTYYYIVRKDCGSGNFADASSQFTTLAPAVCTAPTSVSGVATSATTAQITFSGGTSTSAYIIEYGPSSSFPSGTLTANVSGSPATLSGLSPNTAYTFVVRTDCGGGTISGNSSQGTFSTPNTTSCVPGTWEGTVSTDWHTAGNWCDGILPTGSTDVIIPSGTPFAPTISANAASNNLTILAGATLTLGGGTLTVNGIYLNSGTLADNGLGSLVFTGSTPQILGKPGSTITFLDLTAGPGGILLAGPVEVRRVLTLNGNLTTNSFSFSLLADAAFQAMVVNNSGIVIGDARFERYINPGINGGLGYRHLSSPVQNATISQLNDPNVNLVVNPAYNSNPTPGTTRPFPTIYRYNESRLTTAGNSTFTFGWESPNALSDPMTPGIGFTVNMPPVEVDIAGTLNNGSIGVGPLSRGNTVNSGWHLLGNPYPAPIDWDLVSIPTGLDNAVYVFRSTGQYSGQYVSYVNGVGPTGTELIAAMQGFFLRVNSGSPTFTFTNTNRVTTYQNPALYKQSRNETRPLVALSLQNTITQIPDKLFVYFENGATAGTDSNFDAFKIYNMLNVPTFYSQSGPDWLSINGLPANAIPGTTVPVGAYVPQPGTYTINAEQIINFNPNQDIFLEDLEAGITQNLRQQPTYSFTATQNDLGGRFVLRFGPATVSGTSGEMQHNQIMVYPNPNHGLFTVSIPTGGNTHVEAELYNAIGQRVWTKTFKASNTGLKESINLEKLPKGVYSLRLQTATGPVLKKIVIE